MAGSGRPAVASFAGPLAAAFSAFAEGTRLDGASISNPRRSFWRWAAGQSKLTSRHTSIGRSAQGRIAKTATLTRTIFRERMLPVSASRFRQYWRLEHQELIKMRVVRWKWGRFSTCHKMAARRFFLRQVENLPHSRLAHARRQNDHRHAVPLQA